MELKEIQQRMHTGRLYPCSDRRLVALQEQAAEVLWELNQTRPSEGEKRDRLLRQLLGSVGEDCYVTLPFHVSWGAHVHMGSHVYANTNLTLVDDTRIEIGDYVMFGPNVTVCTATHPVDPELRRQKIEYNLPITFGNNVWLGGGVFLMPGVTIGENSIIGANSVVTRDIPANVVALGSPCRVLRSITEEDHRQYDHGRPVDLPGSRNG